MTGEMLNAARREAERVMQGRATTRLGVVTNYDPASYSAKVRVQPEDVETGWLPIASLWVGAGWGLFCPPTPGDVVEVQFQEGGRQAAMIGLRHFGDALRPLSVPSGEFWLQHQSGSFLKFKNDGSVELHTAGNLTATVEGDLNATVGGETSLQSAGNVTATAPEFNLTGNVTVDGDIYATGDITDLDGVGGTVGRIREIYNDHYHPAPGGNTSTPIEQL